MISLPSCIGEHTKMDVVEFILLSRTEEHTHMGVGGLVYLFSLERMEEHAHMGFERLVYLLTLESKKIVVMSAAKQIKTTK